jgi:ABC-type uncharacterized transport system ATPase subunit
MDNGSIIEVKNLTKMFGKFTAVDDISFNVKKGEIFGLLGPNGAGKVPLLLSPSANKGKLSMALTENMNKRES